MQMGNPDGNQLGINIANSCRSHDSVWTMRRYWVNSYQQSGGSKVGRHEATEHDGMGIMGSQRLLVKTWFNTCMLNLLKAQDRT
jgi:hypothetical protein